MDVVGLVAVLLFYIALLICGIWIAKWKSVLHPETSRDLILAGRSLGFVVGTLTLVATEVGGAFVNGTAEVMFQDGVLWALAPVGYSLSMTINGLFFVEKLRKADCVTCIDVLQNAYGQTVGALIYLPSCIGDVCWTAAVLSALGGTLAVILDMEKHIVVCVVVSAAIAIGYTLVGGMYSVAYTDVLQLVFIFAGLFIAIPFVIASEKADIKTLKLTDWTGKINGDNWMSWIDGLLLILCGGIPWQPYYQRALSVKSQKVAKDLSVMATVICILFIIPSVLIGGAAKTSNWSRQTSVNLTEDASLVLPVTIKDLAPRWVSITALAAISAAAMSSVDSSLLSGASYLTHNIFAGVIRGKNDVFENKSAHILAFRIFILFLGVCSTALSLSTATVYGLWVLAGDFGYVIVFPQFLMAVHWPQHVNAVGSVSAALVGTVLRILIGEPMLSLDAIIVPTTIEVMSNFPAKTALMLITLAVLIFASKASRLIGWNSYTYRVPPI